MASIDFTQLAWDPNNDISNYTTLASDALAQNGGRSWIVESAGPVPMGYQTGQGGNPALDTTYEGTCAPQMLIPAGCGAEAGAPGDPDAGGPGDGGDAGAAMPDGGCQPIVIPCDDLDVALTGIDSYGLQVTRLRAQLPSTALAADLVLEASASQAAVPSFHVTQQYTVKGYNPCPAGSSNGASPGSSQPADCSTTPKPGTRYADVLVMLLAAVGVAFGARRRRRA